MNTTNTTLVLDIHALNTLFPEGSEARVELRRVAMTEMVRRLFGNQKAMPEDAYVLFKNALDTHKNELAEALKKAVQDHHEAVLQNEGICKIIKETGWVQSKPKVVLTELAKELIAASVKSAFADEYRAQIKELLPTLLADSLKASRIPNLIDDRLKKYLDSEAGKKIKALLGS